MYEHWPWWFNAITLSVLAISFFLATRRLLTGSGNWTRVVSHDNLDEINQTEGPFRKNPRMLNDALMKATIEEFGYKKVVDFLAQRKGEEVDYQELKSIKMAARTNWTVHLIFLITLILGGFFASLISGNFSFQANFGELHILLFGGGTGYWITLILGGSLIGFGTQLAGGCSFGHGLGGCPRFVPASLIATGVFFMTAIITSVLIHYLITGAMQ